MAEYYLKTPTYVYRITYRQDGVNYIVDATHVSGTGKLPDGITLSKVDQPCADSNVTVDQILGNCSNSSVADYRTAAKAQIDASW